MANGAGSCEWMGGLTIWQLLNAIRHDEHLPIERVKAPSVSALHAPPAVTCSQAVVMQGSDFAQRGRGGLGDIVNPFCAGE